jgi:hypothetical protein
MLITAKFVFLHLSKAGGIFVNDIREEIFRCI